MSSRTYLVAIALALCASVAVGEYQYIKKGYTPPPLNGSTTCVKQFVGNTPATCPPPLVPLTDKGENGSTVCIATTEGKYYEAVFSLMEPSDDPSAIPGCTSSAQCGGGKNPSFVCGTNGPNGVGVPNTCFPLAPSGCPFPAADSVNKTSTTTAGRKMVL
jgi:hypothetical protein